MRNLITALILVFLFAACKDKPVTPDNNTNLIKNWGFETSTHEPDSTGWKNIGMDSINSNGQSGYITQDAPPDGGKWCLKTFPLWFGPDDGYFPQTYVTNQSGNNIYELSAYVKTDKHPAYLGLYQLRNGLYIHQKQLIVDTTGWNRFSLLDTMNLQPQDSITVILSAGMTEIANWYVYFDLVSLVKK